MKRLLLWLIGVALGVVVLLAAVLGVSYSFTSEGAKPASEVQFAGQELEPMLHGLQHPHGVDEILERDAESQGGGDAAGDVLYVV